MAISRMNMERQLRNMGGLMTLEEPRQGYFLGKIVRKAKKAVKKVVKSPLGKLAILGGLGAYAGGLGPFAGIKGAGFAKPFFGGLKTGFLNPLMQGPMATRSGGFGRTIGQFIRNKPGTAALLGLGATAIAAPFLMGGDEEEVDPGVDVSGIQPMVAGIRDQARQFYRSPAEAAASGLFFMPQRRFVQDSFLAADGGLADIPREGYESGERVSGILKLLSRLTPFGAAKELASNIDMDDLKKLSMITPAGAAMQLGKKLAMKDGGMIDMGGLEKDYREGGFVPIGAEERADDVPAMLSKNEFVFTADAVRGAGNGSIEKGAQRMYDTMKKLEKRVV